MRKISKIKIKYKIKPLSIIIFLNLNNKLLVKMEEKNNKIKVRILKKMIRKILKKKKSQIKKYNRVKNKNGKENKRNKVDLNIKNLKIWIKLSGRLSKNSLALILFWKIYSMLEKLKEILVKEYCWFLKEFVVSLRQIAKKR